MGELGPGTPVAYAPAPTSLDLLSEVDVEVSGVVLERAPLLQRSLRFDREGRGKRDTSGWRSGWTTPSAQRPALPHPTPSWWGSDSAAGFLRDFGGLS